MAKKTKFNSCKSCCRRFDELIMKPVFIHNYDKELLKKREEFLDLF
jgi:hypothetical protein